MSIDFDKVIKNIDTINGIQGLKKLFDCGWCKGEVKKKLLKYIVNRYGFVLDNKKNKEMVKYKNYNPTILEVRDKSVVAKKLNVPINKIKDIGGRYMVFGKQYSYEGKKL